MAADNSPETVASTVSATPPFWFRLRFRKAEGLRLVSHIDLMHVFERLFRRAGLPIAMTRGYHPKPMLVFAQALGLGIAGSNEIADLALNEPLGPSELLDRLNRQAPPGLAFLEVRVLEGRRSPVVRRAFYRCALPAPVVDLPARCQALLSCRHCFVERRRPKPRRVDIRPYLADLAAEAAEVRIALWVTPYGTARPEEVLAALGLAPLLDAGAMLERTGLELMDELPEPQRWLPDLPRLGDSSATQADDPATNHVAAAARDPGRSAPHALIAHPWSFET
ncbi:MAG: TIGR03936 family radical SAM-associated protein [Gemmataceae bacterium]|nr:TIGR03936 family radical SAM-associated protein [Gemmataceae bacterium]